MALRDIFGKCLKEKANQSEASKDVAQNYIVGEFTEEDLSGCTACYPKFLSIDDGPLFNSATKISAQILVATGQRNWLKDIGDEKKPWGEVCRALGANSEQLEEISGGLVRINGTDMEFEDANGTSKVAVIVLPQFIRVNTSADHCVSDVARILQIQKGQPPPPNTIPVLDRGYILLCSHRTRDKRCGITAPIMKQALDIELRHEGLYRDPYDDEKEGIRVVMCNHVGGHKFAANALIYKNTGMALMLARLRPEHARAIVQKTILKEIVVPENVRFCTKLESFTW